MAEGSNMLIIMMCINIFLYIGTTGMGSANAQLVENDITSLGYIQFDESDSNHVMLGDALTEKPQLQSSSAKTLYIVTKVFDGLEIVWTFLMTLLNVLTVPFTMTFKLFTQAAIVGKYLALLIFAPLSIAYTYVIIMAIRGVAS